MGNSWWKGFLGLEPFRKKEYPKIDVSQLEAQDKLLNERIDKLREAVLNGEEEWLLCLVRKENKGTCDAGPAADS
jgi:hypothetical protein